MRNSNSGIAGLYGLLANIFATEVSPELLAQLRSADFRELFTELKIDLGEDFYSGDAAEIVDQLAVEFAGLFLGPGHFISPHESVHHVRDDGDYGTLWGADTVAVKKFIEATGLSYKPEFGGMPDHIAVELEFIQKLEERYAQAVDDGEMELADNLMKIKKRFFTEHLLAWAPEFLTKVAERATLPFYREMAVLLQLLLEQENRIITESTEECAPV
ncbi:dehydrogenase [Desulfolithobacter dissulfuricans]|uniref:Dehydrogenase n=1 Tax=Desulfolithobacter dissulfuricans TaxID=2795293 RepID=A0A915TYS0_9BACT|nr:molecular chaperone TorD family protein [Desulfolithobacter dissulfuricans]BCO08281.1 dehydrogenase [Desulfolithobacter dissulfuricans]